MLFLAASIPDPVALAAWLGIAFFLLAGLKLGMDVVEKLKGWNKPKDPVLITPQPLEVKMQDVFVTNGRFEETVELLRQAIAAVKEEAHNNHRDLQAYLHSSVHELRNSLQESELRAQESRMSLHEKLSALGQNQDAQFKTVAEKQGELRGEMKHVAAAAMDAAAASRAAAEAARIAASSTGSAQR